MRPLAFSTRSTCSCSARPRLSPARRSMSARKPWMAPPALAARAPPLALPAPAACHSEQPASRAWPRRTSRRSARHPLADTMRDELRLVALVEGGVEADRLAARAAGPEFLAEAAGVVGDEPVGRFQDSAGGAVVLLEAEQLRRRVVAAELLEVPGARAPEAVNRVVRDDAASNEVMCALDVEIIDLARVWLRLDALHDVEAG